MRNVGAKIDKVIRTKFRQLFSEDRGRIGRRIVALTVEDLSNGGERRTGWQDFEVDDDLADAFERVDRGNKPKRNDLVEQYLREELERLE